MGQQLSRDVLITDSKYDDDPVYQSNSLGNSKPLSESSWFNFLRRDLKSRLTIVVMVTLILGFIFPIVCLKIIYSLLTPPHYTCSINAHDRVPCILAGFHATSESCEDVGCCWDEAGRIEGSRQPLCYHTRPSRYDYVISGLTTSINQTILNMVPRIEGDSAKLTTFNKDMLDIILTVDHITSTYVRIRATSKDGADIDSPWPDLNPADIAHPVYKVAHSSKGDRFVLKIFRDGDMKTPILTMDEGPLVMTNNYVEFTVHTPTTNVYGLGQGSHATLKHNMTWETEQLFARSDLNSGYPNGSLAYGVHPIYFCVEVDGSTHGVIIGLSQLTDVSLQPQPSITFRTSGRLIDIHLFMGPTPQDVARQMTDLIGKPSLPPPWALGYHTCRSYGNVSVAQKVAEDLLEMGIPHESECGDSRLMRSLGPSTSALQELKIISEVLKKSSLKLVLFLGPQILNGTRISTADVFITDPNLASNQPYYGKVDGKDVVYPDFSSDNFSMWFAEAFQEFQDDLWSYGIALHGLLLVDNTPLDSANKTTKPCLSSNGFQLPPVAEFLKDVYKEAYDTVCLNAIQRNGTSPHYVHHNMYGYTHLKSVSDVINAGTWASSNISTQVLGSLSTFSGSGQYGGHWGGEYPTSWGTMKNSLVHLMEFNLYGIPLVGVPICGYTGDIGSATQGSSVTNFDPGLCWRWMQLGFLYPLAFTYYGPKELPREPNYFPKDFQTMSINMLQLRYSLFPYLYTQFQYAHINGDPVMRPMFYEFPKDKKTLDIDEQFLLGSALLVAPALHPFPSQVNAYFPAGCWYEFHTHFRMCFDEYGSYESLLPSINLPNIYIRGGLIIFQQLPAGVTLDITRRSNYTVTIALDGDVFTPKASGSLVLGDTTGTTSINFEVVNNTFSNSCLGDCERSLADVSTVVDTLLVLGLLEKPKIVTLNSVNITSSMEYNLDVHSMKLSGIYFDLVANMTLITWL